MIDAKLDAASDNIAVTSSATARELLELAEDARTPDDFARVLERFGNEVGGVDWRPFGGDQRVAHSALGAASDSTHLIAEPVVNMIDAQLEQAHRLAQLEAETSEPSDVWDAAKRYFSTPGHLADWDTKRNPNRAVYEDLAKRCQLLIREGSSPDTPTLVFRDSGIGQHPADFEKTILSLQLGNKADVAYLAGQYGHGAGMTLSFSGGGQILISRRNPRLLMPGQDDLVGLVLIKRVMPSESGKTNPIYSYAVPKGSLMPLAMPPDVLRDPEWHGLHRICIDYETQKREQRALYLHMDHNLPDPPLPYAIRDQREDKQWRFMSGNASRLEDRHRNRGVRSGKQPINVPYRRTSTIDLTAWVGSGKDLGIVEVTVTYVRQEGTGRGNELFGPVTEAETWTVNGQTHNARTRVHFGQKTIGLDAIRENLIVHVALDGLSADAKALVVTTGRQNAAERGLTTQLEAAIDDLLANDPDLQRLNSEAKEAALKRAADSSIADLDKELRRFQYFVKRMMPKRGKRKKKRRKRERPTPEPLEAISPLHEHPMFLRFRTVVRDCVTIRPGSTASVLLEADAVDNYFPSHELAITLSDHQVRFVGAEQLIGGRMRVRIRADEEAAPGSHTMFASCLPPTVDSPMVATIGVNVVDKPARTQTSRGGSDGDEELVDAPPPYQVIYREHDDAEKTWKLAGFMNWDESIVGDFHHDVAYVNGDYDPLKDLLDDSTQSLREETLHLYLAPVIITLVGLAKEENDPPTDDRDQPVQLHPRYKRAALESIAQSSIFTIRKLRRLDLEPLEG